VKRLSLILAASALALASCGGASEESSSSSDPGPISLSGALKAAQGMSFAASGTLSQVMVDAGDEIPYATVYSALDGDVAAISEMFADGEEAGPENASFYYKNAGGYVCHKARTLQNEVVEETVTSNGSAVAFDDVFKNPFADLSYSDFAKGADESHFILKPDYVVSFAISLLHMTVYAQKVTFTVVGSRFASVEISTYASTGSIGLSNYDKFDLSFEFGVDLSVPDLQPYAHASDHDTLQTACTAIADSLSAMNYTATCVYSNIDGDEVAGTYNLYSTAPGYYYDQPDSNGTTYGVILKDGSLYEFSRTAATSSAAETLSVSDDALEGTRASLEPNYLGFAPEIMGAESATSFYTEDSMLVGQLAWLLAPHPLRDYLSSTAVGVGITLNDGGSFKNAYFEYVDADILTASRITVTYGSIGSTSLPVSA
jgi:hypothetical protein